MKQRVDSIQAKMDELSLPDIRLWLDKPDELISYLTQQLIDFRDALPIISALKQQGAYELITILNTADEQSLRAFARLTKDRDLSALVDVFLVKNSKELDSINRNLLFQFLRQPNLSGWLSRFLESLENRAHLIMSIRFLMITLDSTNSQLQLSPLRHLLKEYPFPIDLKGSWSLIEWYNELSHDLSSSMNNEFITLIFEVIKRMSTSSQSEFIKGLNQQHVLLIIEKCLEGAVSNNLDHQQTCNNLLFILLSQSNLVNIKSQSPPTAQFYKELLKRRLGQVDSYLFNSPELEALAKEITGINSTKLDLNDHWLKTLLTSPRFIAASNPEVLKLLSDRYKLLILLFNQTDSTELSFQSTEQSPIFEQINDSFMQINKDMMHHPETMEILLAKKSRLIKYAIDTHINTLFANTETLCEQQKDKDSQTAHKALAVLYRYYRNSLTHLRTDLLFRAIEYAYQKVQEQSIDLDSRPSLVASWFKRFIPDQVFDEKVLHRLQSLWLYNSAGQKIAYLNEANEVLAFVEDEPHLLGNTDSLQIDEPLYDDQKTMIGFITETGQLRSARIVQRNTCAELLALVPEKELEQSGNGLELMIQNVLFENSIEHMYECTISDSKRAWLEKQCTQAVKILKTRLAPDAWTVLVKKLNEESLFLLLPNIQNKANATQLFHSLLNHDKTRDILFSGLYEADFHQFLRNHNVASCFAGYLAHFYDRPWFAEGLLKFAQYAKKYKKETLFSEALSLLNKEVNSATQLEQYNLVLTNLISSEACTEIILKKFINDTSRTAVQLVVNYELSNVVPYFHKQHLIAALHHLNKTSYWEESTQYRLMLHILNSQHNKLFAAPVTSPQAWQSGELIELGTFVSRHLRKKRDFDHQSAIGHRVLGELIFRSALIGQASLFYTDKKLNSKLAGLFFSRSFLECLIDKFWIPEAIREQFIDDEARLTACFDERGAIQKELSEHQTFLDWCMLIKRTWDDVNKNKLPAICAFIMNYTGHKKPLAFALHHYFNAFQNQTDYISPVTNLLHQFPDRDFSAVLFDTLEATVIKTPLFLNRGVLADMAKYYCTKILNKPEESPQAELNLLTYFGQNKQYSLVQIGCEELTKECVDKALKKRLAKGADEAQVEKDLSDKLGHFYFGLFKVFKRLWHYGFNPNKNSSKIVKFCDDDSENPKHKHAENQVKTSKFQFKGSNNLLCFQEKRKQFINLLATIKKSQAHSSLTRVSNTNHGLFYQESKPKQMKDGTIASKSSEVTI